MELLAAIRTREQLLSDAMWSFHQSHPDYRVYAPKAVHQVFDRNDFRRSDYHYQVALEHNLTGFRFTDDAPTPEGAISLAFSALEEMVCEHQAHTATPS